MGTPNNIRTFEEARSDVSKLIDGKRRLGKAYKAAKDLVVDFPGTAQAWFVLNLVVCISNRGPGVVKGAERYIKRALECLDGTDQVHGDMLRDEAIGIARFCHGKELSNAELEILAQVRELHKGDANRLACATGVQGRLCAARGDHIAAVDLYKDADDWWSELGSLADAGWVHRNWIEWLRSEVNLFGTDSEEARDLFKRIKQGGGNMRRAKMIMKPSVGLYLDHLAITHR